ncbi:MAG: beta-ketoacyl-ACP synthase II [Rhabdochlamydiaceae bacterium]|nr:beta-ketoacyl-ACP synthase II [Rhabdochlamydiaceae bacterium]
MQKKRVVITGMGIVSCFGNDVDAFYEALLQGQSGVGPIEEFPCEAYPTRFAAAVKKFDVGDYLDKKQARRVDPFIRYAMVAGKKALENSGLKGDALGTLKKNRCGILIGSGMGGMQTFTTGVETLIKEGYRRMSPFFVPFIITNMGGALLAIDTGFTGPNYSISTACATSNFCIYSAAEHIRRGDADLMVCGGAEASLTPVGLGGFVACKALSERNDAPQKASRPWDKNRDGFVIGEGSGVLILESLEHALARGAPIIAEYLGGSTNCDAYHMTSPREDGSGVAGCIELAIQDAGIPKEQINYINAHATSTPVGDICEILGVKKCFGDHLKNISINSTKSMIGHCLGAAGGIEAIATLKAIQTGKIHPTINVDDPEEIMAGIDYVPNEPRTKNVTAALSNSFGFGGHNSSLVFGPYKQGR